MEIAFMIALIIGIVAIFVLIVSTAKNGKHRGQREGALREAKKGAGRR